METEQLPTTICMINQKGGCGKSSMCFHLSGYFAQAGMSVLLVDADPQGSLSQGFFGSAYVETLEPHDTLTAVFDDRLYFHPACTLPVATAFAGISIIPSNQSLAPCNRPSPETEGMTQYALRHVWKILPASMSSWWTVPPISICAAGMRCWPPTTWSCQSRRKTLAPKDLRGPSGYRERTAAQPSPSAAGPSDHAIGQATRRSQIVRAETAQLVR